MDFNQQELINILLSVSDTNDKVNEYLNNYTIKNITEHKKEMDNTHIFTKIIDTNVNKSIITEELNKLNNSNLDEVANNLRKLSLKNLSDIDDLIDQIVNKIIKETTQNKFLFGSLCFELQTLLFVLKDNKYIFKNLLLDRVKKQYTEIMNFTDEDFSEDYGKRIITVIAVLYNSKIINDNVFNEIINDHKNLITYNEKMTKENFETVEKALNQLCFLLTIFKDSTEILVLTDNINKYLEKQLTIYNEKKCISKKVRIICENTISYFETK